MNKLVTKNRGSLSARLISLFLLFALVPLGLTSWISYQQANESLSLAAEDKLIQTSNISINFIKTWFRYRFIDLHTQAESQNNVHFIKLLINGFYNSKKSLPKYIKSDDWSKISNEYKADLESFSRRYDYIYDLLLIDKKGNVLYTIANEADLGTNLFTGVYSDTLFSKAARTSLQTGKAVFSDLERYQPSNNIITGFLTAPLIDVDGSQLGVLAIQIYTNKVLDILNENINKKSSLEYYLVGTDRKLRSSFGQNKNEVLIKEINSKPIDHWMSHLKKGMKGVQHSKASIYMGPNGKLVIGLHHMLKLPGVNWVLISEINKNEALASALYLAKVTLALFLVTAVIILFLAVYQARNIARPIVRLLKASQDVAKGNMNQKVEIHANNEIGGLADAFNYMLSSRYEFELKLKEKTKQAQQALDELDEQRFALAQHSIVAITDVKGSIIFVNEKFSEISGYKENELIGENHRLLNSGYHSSEFFKEMYNDIAHGRVWHNEVCNKAKDGSLYWVDTTVVPFFGDNGKPKSYISIRTDITKSKTLAENLLLEKEKAEEAAKIKSQFLANMSHEIRTPMNGVLGMLGLLKNTSLDKDQLHRLNIAQSSGHSLLVLINDILDFSKIDAGKLELEVLDFDLSSMLGDMSESMAFQAQQKNLEIILDIKNIKYSMVRGDADRLRQIFTNIVSNAIKFTEHGEVIVRVVLTENNNKLKLHGAVEDTGIGIPENKIQKMFGLFSQVDSSTTRKYGGTGLGLSIAKKICQLMGGDITVSSEEGKGSCFEFDVYLEKSKQSKALIPPVDIKSLNVLIVDDNETNLQVLQEQFECWGVTVVCAINGQGALQECEYKIKKNKALFDIVFLDMEMPEMDGIELSKIINADDRLNHMKLIMMTSMEYEGDAAFFADLDVDAYFPKPTTLSDLFDALSVVIENKHVLKQGKKPVPHYSIGALSSVNLTSNKSKNNWPKELRILLVEDNQINQMVATGILNDFGLVADVASNGVEAIQYIKNALHDVAYTLILMDCQMPEMDGYEATRKIRASEAGEANKDIVIIAMTANAMSGDREKCLSAGMNDYLPKPIDVEILQSKIQQWCSITGEYVVTKEDKVDVLEYGSIDESPIWDRASAVKRVMGKEKLLQSMLSIFLKETPERLRQLKAYIENEDAKNIALIMHTFKGVAANLSAIRLQKFSAKMELSAKDNDFDFIKNNMSRFEVYIDDCTLCFEAELIEVSVSAKEDTLSLDNKKISSVIEGFIVHLKQNEFIDPAELEQLLALSNKSPHKDIIEELCEQISILENEAALNIIQDIFILDDFCTNITM